MVRSRSQNSVSSVPSPARAITAPDGSHTNDSPANVSVGSILPYAPKVVDGVGHPGPRLVDSPQGLLRPPDVAQQLQPHGVERAVLDGIAHLFGHDAPELQVFDGLDQAPLEELDELDQAPAAHQIGGHVLGHAATAEFLERDPGSGTSERCGRGSRTVTD